MCIKNKSFFASLIFQCEELKDGTPTVKTGIAQEDIERKILIINGPCCSIKRCCTSFSSNIRQTASKVEDTMENLQKRGLGKCDKLQQLIIFCKALPSEVIGNEFLGMYKLNETIYENIFKKKDEQTPHFQRKKMFNNHPQYDQLATLGVDMSE